MSAAEATTEAVAEKHEEPPTAAAAATEQPSAAAEQRQRPLPLVRDIENVTIKTLTDVRIIEKLRVLDKYCFPVSYSEKYYAALMPNGVPQHNLNQIAYYCGILVGSCTCRIEQATKVEGKYRCYVMTLGVLEPYRRLGIATKLIQTVLANAALEPEIAEVALHVKFGSAAIPFYTEHFDFKVVQEVQDYYTNLTQPLSPDALLLSKEIVHVPHEKKEKKGRR